MNNPQQPYSPTQFQQPQPKSNKKLWIILGIVIGVPVILMGGCAACVALLSLSAANNPNLANRNSPPTSSSTSNTSSSQPATPVRPEIDGMPVYKTGENVNVGYMQYEVYDAWYTNRLSTNQFLDQPPDATYLFVDLGVANVDKEERTVPQFKLIDENKAEYGTSDKAWAAEGSIGLLQNLNPSVAKRAYVIFDVPIGRNYKLKVSGGYWSSDDALIELSPSAKKKK